MKLKHPLINKALGLASSTVLKTWMSTIDCRVVYEDPTLDYVHPRCSGRAIFIGWHEYLLAGAYLRSDQRMATLTSAHGDGDIIARTMRHLGMSVVRGSTFRGASSALLKLLREDRRHLYLTSDGPRGPRRQLSQGAVFLAGKLGMPLLCAGWGYHRPWRLNSWDRFAIPRPFSRVRCLVGHPIQIPSRLNRQGLEAYRLFAEQMLNWLTGQAEHWAETGKRRPFEMPFLRRQAAPAMRQPQPPGAIPLPAWLNQQWRELEARYGRAEKPKSAQEQAA